ncbi:unnamed protein product, partial [Musa acuminata subsp. burmannicoides]
MATQIIKLTISTRSHYVHSCDWSEETKRRRRRRRRKETRTQRKTLATSFMRPGLAWQKAANSLKSMLPSPSVSISAMVRFTSSPEVEPSVRRTSPSSASEILPSPLVSKRLKIRSISGVTSPISDLRYAALLELKGKRYRERERER